MDAFGIRDKLVEGYKSFSEGFVEIQDDRIRQRVEAESDRGRQWPDPWLSLNPSFKSGGSVDELVSRGVLHAKCSEIFRPKKDELDKGSAPITLHKHQSDAIEVAARGGSYVLTTGTGSGKSLAYIMPIVDRVLREGSGKGVKAIVVYPMNALANSQMEELGKFLKHGFDGEPPVTFERYTGQESPETRERILNDPPDILLTNYVMLDLVLTRPDERRRLIDAAEGLKFLVLDELHTYRGRQGADVALLVRRLRNACRVHELAGRPAVVYDAKYKTASYSGSYPNADHYQMLAYCTALSVKTAWLVYAGAGLSRRRRILNTDVEIVEFPLDVSHSPAEVLAAVGVLARESFVQPGVPPPPEHCPTRRVGVVGQSDLRRI